MYKIYKKCEKSVDNEYGIKEIKSVDEVNNPFLFCIASKDDDSSTFGIIKEGARAARIRTTDELAGGFKLDEIKVDFLGYKYDNDGNFKNIVDDFIYPLLSSERELSKMIKAARRMNFFVYCNAAEVYVQIEKRLKERLLTDGLSENDIKRILSQISLVCIATEIDVSNVYATTAIFKDANDKDVYDYISKVGEKRMNYNNRMSTLGNLRTDGNGVAYVFYGDGEHNLKSYFNDNNIVKSSLCATVSRLVENSLKNEKSKDFIPISSKTLIPIILRYNAEFENNDILLNRLDNSLDYEASRYSENEHYELKEFEESLKKENRL